MRSPIVTAAALLLSMPLLGGCLTLVGGGVGYLVDSGKPDYQVASRADLVAHDQGDRVLIVAPDGKLYRGRYWAALSESGEEFARAYERWRAPLPDSLQPPTTQQRLAVHIRTNGEPIVFFGFLTGFDRDTAYFKTNKGGASAAWEDIERWTDPAGAPYPVPLAAGSPESGPPFLGSVQLRAEEWELLETIAWSDVLGVRTRRPKNSWKVGAAIGLGLDVAFLVACVATECYDMNFGWSMN